MRCLPLQLPVCGDAQQNSQSIAEQKNSTPLPTLNVEVGIRDWINVADSVGILRQKSMVKVSQIAFRLYPWGRLLVEKWENQSFTLPHHF